MRLIEKFMLGRLRQGLVAAVVLCPVEELVGAVDEAVDRVAFLDDVVRFQAGEQIRHGGRAALDGVHVEIADNQRRVRTESSAASEC